MHGNHTRVETMEGCGNYKRVETSKSLYSHTVTTDRLLREKGGRNMKLTLH